MAAVAHRKQAGGYVIGLSELTGIVVDADQIDHVGMPGIGRGAGEAGDGAVEAAGGVELEFAGAAVEGDDRPAGDRTTEFKCRARVDVEVAGAVHRADEIERVAAGG